LEATGPAALNGVRSFFDVSVVSPASSKSSQAAKSVLVNPEEPKVKLMKRKLAALISRKEEEKMSKYSHLFKGDFMPMVMTSGGTTSKVWGSVMARLKQNSASVGTLRFNLSITLIRVRARHYVL